MLDQRVKKIGGDIANPSKDCKHLDFETNLSGKVAKAKKEGPAAGGGRGREFINIDEII